MSHPLEGKFKGVTVTTASAGAGNTDVTLQPDEGKLWEILYCHAVQDDGAVSQSWFFIDPGGTITLESITGAANVRWRLLVMDDAANSPLQQMGPLIATYTSYYKFRFVASAGGKNGTIYALVKEYSGVEPKL